ncbi:MULTISPECIES: type II secretion system protein [Dictyoglomus]|uniref:N-terminal methylation motif domain protein n=1 Tax=Dictyoglomus turgidum (strain DSM 6724 / Z-1310) TaxID=515635 RepID=B8E076_DICTD|nr:MULTISPECIES: type II secretion system protein [Dictyoglomus]ACK42159.1 N-terminal methylation motif domain protein [Dictyoglomus turgidum DSM 6724]HBU32389.1 prepilin-type cleavage/methylation domain-containing protein [Dictyoglomus sp.]
MRREKGFTLIELMVVIVIIAILAAVALPNFMGATERARESAVRSAVKTLQTALEMYATDNQGYYPDYIYTLKNGNYLPGGKFPNNPATNAEYGFTANNNDSGESAYKIVYTVSTDHASYTITGYGKDNQKVVIQVSSAGTLK